MTLGVILVVCLAGGVIAAAIAKSKGHSAGAFFVFGALFPLIGIIVAALQTPVLPPPPPPQPPGWYTDPWGTAQWRWYDGQTWTWQTA